MKKEISDLTPEELASLGPVKYALHWKEVRALDRLQAWDYMKVLCMDENPGKFKGRVADEVGQLTLDSISDPSKLLLEDVQYLNPACARGLVDILLDLRLAVRQQVCAILGSEWIEQNTLENYLDLAMNCQNTSLPWYEMEEAAAAAAEAGMSEVPETPAEDLLTSVASQLGKLANFLTKEEVDAFSPDDVLSWVCEMDPNAVEASVSAAVVTKLCEISGDLPQLTDCMTWRELRLLKGCVALTEMEDIVAYEVAEIVENPVLDALEILTEEEKTAVEGAMADLSGQLVEIILEKAETIDSALSGARKRRRRQATPPTCNVLKELKENVVMYLTDPDNADVISSMDKTEVDLCRSTLGAVLLPPDVRAKVLGAIMDSTPACDFYKALSAAQVAELGYLLLGLETADIACLTDVDWTIGEISEWTDTQLTEFAKKFKELESLSDMATVTAEQVASLNHFICGFTAAEIDAMPAEAITSNVVLLAGMERCPLASLTALTTKAKANYDMAVADWTMSEFDDIGILLGGLSGAELGSVSEEGVSAWSPAGIMHMSTAAIPSITESQLKVMSRSQAMAFTESQIAAMTPEQKAARQAAEDGEKLAQLDEQEADEDDTTMAAATTKSDNNGSCSLVSSLSLLGALLVITVASFGRWRL